MEVRIDGIAPERLERRLRAQITRRPIGLGVDVPERAEHRLAYRIQELVYGGLKPETLKHLREFAEDLDGGDPSRRRQSANDRPIAGTQLIREYQGVEHCVTVRDEDFEYQGRPYKSLSAIARAITGTRWNGLLFFGLKNRHGQ